MLPGQMKSLVPNNQTFKICDMTNKVKHLNNLFYVRVVGFPGLVVQTIYNHTCCLN